MSDKFDFDKKFGSISAYYNKGKNNMVQNVKKPVNDMVVSQLRKIVKNPKYAIVGELDLSHNPLRVMKFYIKDGYNLIFSIRRAAFVGSCSPDTYSVSVNGETLWGMLNTLDVMDLYNIAERRFKQTQNLQPKIAKEKPAGDNARLVASAAFLDKYVNHR